MTAQNNNNRVIRVLIAEDQEVCRMGLRALIQHEDGLELVGEAVSFGDTLSFTEKLKPDVVLLDLTLVDGMIVDRIPELLANYDALKILVLTGTSDKEVHCLALKNGAMGVISKDAPCALLLKAISCIHDGEVWADRHTTATFFRCCQFMMKYPPPLSFTLTAREREIATLAAQGLPPKKIANQLQVADKTVRNQLAVIYHKLGVSSQVELALMFRYRD